MRQGQRTPPGFGAIWSCVALDLVGFGIVLPILPLYAENERFGADAATVGILVASFSLAQLVFAPVTGWLSDRVGRKPVLVLSLAGTSVGSLITGLAGSLWVLFLGRVLDGISGSSVSVAQAAVADLAPPEQRARLLGYLGAAFGVGFVAGPAIGALAVLGGIHVPFIVVAVIAGINALVALRRLPETRPLPVTRANRPEPAPEPPRAPLTGPDGAMGVAGYITVTFVALVAFSAFEATFALFVERRLDLRMVSIYVTFVGVGVLITLVQVGLVHPCVRRMGEGATVRLGLLLNAGGMLVLAAVQSWITLLPALVLLTVGQGLITPVLSSLVAGAAAVGRRGGTLGVQQAAGGLARVIGPVAGGFLLQFAGLSAPYMAGAALLAATVLLMRAPLRAEVPAAP
ncbi:MAG TPA: MFS transporter [Acidimicrobiales bacterium]|nr:MFS transporter [Acidimicrobiales bacterium]